MAATVKERVSTLEQVLSQFMTSTDNALNRLSNEMRDFKAEMSDFKAEMSDFKDEMSEFKNGVNVFKDEMSDFKDEMSDFKDEMSDFRKEIRAEVEESKQMRKDMNKKWGELANKLGTFAEDITAPNLPRIAKTDFKQNRVLRFATNLRATHPIHSDRSYEFDAVAETEEYIFLLETKYTFRGKYLDKIPVIIQNFKECFPEYTSKKLVTIFASMSIHENTVKKLTKMGIYAMAMGEDTMDLLNFDAIRKKEK